MKVLQIYTDGSFNPSENLGAYSFIIVSNGKILFEKVRGFNKKECPNMTINRMELKAVIKSVNWIRSNGYKPNKSLFYIFSDSQYVHLGTNSFFERRMNFSKNNNLWKDLDRELNSFNEFKSIFIQWIPSDSKDVFHQRAHKLCQLALKRLIKNKSYV